MDIEFKYGRKKRRVVMILGVVLAAAAFTGVLLTTSAKPAVAEVPMRTVLVAVADIPPRTVIDASMLTTRSVADDASLANVYADSTEILGRMSAVQIYAHQPITPNLFANSLVGTAFSILEPGETITDETPTWRAVSVNVPKDRAVGGMLEVGQHVDLFTTVEWAEEEAEVVDPGTGGGAGDDTGGDSGAPPGTGSAAAKLIPPAPANKATKVVYVNVQILAKTADDVYVLKVNLHQAEEIAHIQAIGASFGIALRSDGDYRPVDITKYGETNDRLTEEYNFPIPKWIELETYPQTSPEPGPFDPSQPWRPAPPTPAPTADPNASPAPSTDPNATPAPSPEPSATPQS